ncbi:hypothetical protein KSP39_PZI002802 [Platanthera zijinensis]|uniref:Uncharacterized protein n=1 Tax=Platanthera zijinensis TaxID=2320716 RepID=A0AAP0GEN1_9ASPA
MRQRELQAQFVIKRGLPFSVFDNDDATEYIHGGLQPKYQKVSRITLRRDALKFYLAVKEELINYFENFEGRVSLTSDVWTSNLNLGLSYLCITCHWIDPISWEQNKRVICFTGFEYPHTAVALYKVIMKCAREFKINDKILSISLDNAANNGAAIELLKRDLKPFLNGTFFHTRCVCHVLNLIVQDSLKGMEEYINKIRNMLKTIYCTKQRAQDFRKFCKAQSQRYLKPEFDLPVRWNSTYKMLKRAVLQKEILMEYYSLLNIEHNLGENDWDIIEHYLDLLKCFIGPLFFYLECIIQRAH